MQLKMARTALSGRVAQRAAREGLQTMLEFSKVGDSIRQLKGFVLGIRGYFCMSMIRLFISQKPAICLRKAARVLAPIKN